MRIYEEDFALFALGLLDVALFVQLMGFDDLAIGVVFAGLVELALVLLHLLHEGRHVRKRGLLRGGLLGRAEGGGSAETGQGKKKTDA